MTTDPITRLNAALEGRYRVERELGEGGMATVYLAEEAIGHDMFAHNNTEARMRRTPHRILRLVRAIVLGLAVTASLGACASAGTGTSNAFSAEEERGAPNEIVRAEILRVATANTNAYEVIRRLRPRWFQPRGFLSFTDPNIAEPVVYLNQLRWGSLASLRQIPTIQIMRMQFIGATEATTRWGTGHAGGVIDIETMP